jgi:hypothetical protein
MTAKLKEMLYSIVKETIKDATFEDLKELENIFSDLRSQCFNLRYNIEQEERLKITK